MVSRYGYGLRRQRISPELIEEVIRQDEEDIPDDARLMRLDYDAEDSTYVALLESSEWSNTAEAEYVPWMWEDY